MPEREPLWKVNDQAARLAELVSQAGDLKEAPLRRDVRSLGRLLGEVLKEQVGIEFFTAVEELRLLLIEHREARARREASDKKAVDEDQLMDRAQRIVNGLGIVDAHRMAKAFAIYFELTNLAETNHRKRRRRAAQVSLERQAQPGTFLGYHRAAGFAMVAASGGYCSFHGPSHRGRAADCALQEATHCRGTGAPGSPSASCEGG